MYRVTTPTHTFTLPVQTSTCTIIRVAYRQLGTKLLKVYENGTLSEGMELDGKKVIIKLTQEETKSFNATDPKNPVYAQVRAMTEGGDVFASQQFAVSIEEVIDDEVLQ